MVSEGIHHRGYPGSRVMDLTPHQQSPAPAWPSAIVGEFLVVCLCAEWCGVCREYRSGFEELAAQFPAAGFYWLDIEVHAEELGDLEVENFPTLIIKRKKWVLFYGSMPPVPSHLRRTLGAFLQQSAEESQHYAMSSAERRCWQETPDLWRVDRDQLRSLCEHSDSASSAGPARA